MKSVFTLRCSAPLLAAIMLYAGAGGALAQPATLLDYGVDLTTTYVSRGVDYFTGVQDKDGAEHSTFNVAPAVQPALTLYGPGGLSFGLWGSFALTNRGKDEGSLKDLDEVDYTFAWDWDNRLGAFTVGLANYATVPAKSGGAAVSGTVDVGTSAAPDIRTVDDGSADVFAVTSEIFITWAPTFMEGLGPSVTHYTDMASSAAYTTFGIGGGEAITWSTSLGLSTKGVQDLTASVGTGIGERMSAAINVAYRPTPAIVGPYDSDGKYTPAGKTKTADYPPAIFWLTFSYGGSVTE